MSGRNNDSRSGYPNGDSREMPADLAAVQADDALLDMLGSAHRAPGDTDDELVHLMAAWRREIHADANPLLVDTNTALAVIDAARRPARRRNPVFGTVAAAAAVLVIAFSAVGLVAKSAQPGDQLWGVTQVLYEDYARSVEAAASVRTELDEAKTAIREGKREQARESLQRIQRQLPVIAEAEGRNDLSTQHRDLQKLVEQSSPPKEDSSTRSPGPGSSAASPTQVPPTMSSGSSGTTTTTQPNPLGGQASTNKPNPTATRTPPAKPNESPITQPGPQSSDSSQPAPQPNTGVNEPGSSSNSSDSSGTTQPAGATQPGSVSGQTGVPGPGPEWQPGP